MHGMIVRSFEGFLRNTYGDALWCEVVTALDSGVDRFEPMFHYDDKIADGLVEIAGQNLGKSRDAMLEDFGTYLVAHPASQRVRRLLRFGGTDYEDFLGSLEDLPGRARLAVPDLALPDLKLTDLGAGQYRLVIEPVFPGVALVFLGLLRALADDYGALVLIEASDHDGERADVSIRLLEADFAEGRGFDLAEVGGATPEALP